MTDRPPVDGNAAAGPLRDLFTVDLSSASCTCAGCGTARPLAEQVVYLDAPALVLRCASCGDVMLRYSSAGGRMRLDLTGTRLLVVADP